jgi:hypothetical protein
MTKVMAMTLRISSYGQGFFSSTNKVRCSFLTFKSDLSSTILGDQIVAKTFTIMPPYKGDVIAYFFTKNFAYLKTLV